jgi:surfeit locus 1 family protein
MPNPVASLLARKRFRPTLWPTLGVAVVVALTLGFGNWQRHRVAEKEALHEQFEHAARQPPLELSAMLPDATALRFRQVRATGEFDAGAQLLIDNRIHSGRPGYEVVAPLRLANDRYVLVDRGWVAQGSTRADLPGVPPPAGVISVEGRINLPPARYLELKTDTGTGPVRQTLDIARTAAASRLPLLRFIVAPTDARDGLVRDWPPPDFGVEQHRSYMLQWYSLALLGCGLWLALSWRSREARDQPAN